ncbi:hypothetical protein ABMX48_25465 [Streptomyces cavourensis]
MTPDQNPHPPTDHDRFAPRGETPMPLVDGVALHQPPASIPPPLFRPREEQGGAGEGTPVTAPAPGPLLDLGPDSDEGPAKAGDSVALPAPGPLLDLDPRPTGDDTGAPAPAQDAASEPDAAPDPDLDLFVGLDPAPSRTGAGGTGPGRDLGSGPDLDARPGEGSSPEPTGEAAPGPDPRAKGEETQAPDPDPSPASPPDAPPQSVSLEHPGRSLHLGQGRPGSRSRWTGRTSRPPAARSVRRAPGTSSPSGV